MNAGGIAAIVDYIGETKGSVRLPGIMMLGYVAAHSENLAMAVVVSKVEYLLTDTQVSVEYDEIFDIRVGMCHFSGTG